MNATLKLVNEDEAHLGKQLDGKWEPISSVKGY